MLTDPKVKNAKVGSKVQRLFDSRGLYLEVQPAGGKWWRLKYRIHGREKRISLGVYPDVSLALARERRDEARRLVAQGIDPSAQRKAEKQALANTVKAVAREWVENQKGRWSPSTYRQTNSRLSLHIYPTIGQRPIEQVTAPEILDMLRKIENKGAVETAHRILLLCDQVFRYAVQTHRAHDNPTKDLRGALRKVNAGNFSAVTKPEDVAPLLRMLHGYKGTPAVTAALHLAPLLFVRPGELRHAEWADVDLDAKEWRYKATKTGTEHIVPLADQAVATLRELHAVTGRGRYVFPGGRDPKRPMSDNAVLAALRRMGIEKDTMSGHGFRAMARTILDEHLGFPAHIVEHQLGHKVKDPNGRAYNRTTHLEERRKMMQSWANYLDALRTDANVVPIKSGAEHP